MTNVTISCPTNICQNNGQCFLSVNGTTTTSFCLCNVCFTGNQCEIELYSQNLWACAIPIEKITNHDLYIAATILGIVGIISIVSNLLSLQTFLFSKKIRITNLGIYLILFSLTGLIASIMLSVYAFTSLAGGIQDLLLLNSLIMCDFTNLMLWSLYYCLYWFCLYIAVERALIEYTFLSLYDSRRRSVISSVLLFILIPLTNLLPILFGRKDDSNNSTNFCLLNYTSTGYIFYLIFDYTNYLAVPLSFTIACVAVFKHLIEHRRDLVDDESFRSSIILIASKHYDFFLQPIIFCLMTAPDFIFHKVMNCERANSVAVFHTLIITQILGYSALALPFFVYVYLSKIYLDEFWQTSPFGRFLIYVKQRFINCCKHQKTIVDGRRLSLTYHHSSTELKY
jgi:hypothetical protein